MQQMAAHWEGNRGKWGCGTFFIVGERSFWTAGNASFCWEIALGREGGPGGAPVADMLR